MSNIEDNVELLIHQLRDMVKKRKKKKKTHLKTI